MFLIDLIPTKQELAAIDFYLNPNTDRPETCPAHSDCLGDDFVPMPKTGFWVNLDNSEDVGAV